MKTKETSSGIKQMWEFKVGLAKYIKFVKDDIMNEYLPKETQKDFLYSHITKIATETINDFYFKK